MDRHEFVNRVSAALKEGDVRKPIRSNTSSIYITDDNGNSAKFDISTGKRTVLYTANDVDAIVGACIDVIYDALKNGESIGISGFGNLHPHYREARRLRNPVTGEMMDCPGHFIPKFDFGRKMANAARAYELLEADKEMSERLAPKDFSEDD